MPMVNGKKFPYTEKGKAAAAKAKKPAATGLANAMTRVKNPTAQAKLAANLAKKKK